MQCYTSPTMPTKRHRHMLTETDEVTEALEAAARQWPDDAGKPGKLLLHLVHTGREAIEARETAETAARRRAVAETSGALTGTFPEGYLAELRGDWPE